jgi:hypothetical protein
MHYLKQGSGAGALAAGGSYVSFVDPTTHDLTIVVESAGPAVGAFCNNNCNGVMEYTAARATQTATFCIMLFFPWQREYLGHPMLWHMFSAVPVF